MISNQHCESLQFIDFEYGCCNYAAFDISNHFCEWAFDYDQENFFDFEKLPSLLEKKVFLQEYLLNLNQQQQQQQPFNLNLDSLITELPNFEIMSHLLWSYWGLIQSDLNLSNFDYFSYSINRLSILCSKFDLN